MATNKTSEQIAQEQKEEDDFLDKMEVENYKAERLPDADDKFEYIRQWELECGKQEKTPEQIKADELDLKEWEESFKTDDDLAWEAACKADNEAWKNSQDELIRQITQSLPKVKDIIKGKLPEYLKPLFILSSMTYQTEKGISYRIAVINKDSSTATGTDSTYLVLNTRNQYKGFADSELRATELADFIIY